MPAHETDGGADDSTVFVQLLEALPREVVALDRIGQRCRFGQNRRSLGHRGDGSMSLANLIVLLLLGLVVWLVMRPSRRAWPKSWPTNEDWLDGFGTEHTGNLPQSLLPEIHQIVVARALCAPRLRGQDDGLQMSLP